MLFNMFLMEIASCSLLPITYRRQSHSIKTRMQGRGFHTLIRNASFPSPIEVGSQTSNNFLKKMTYRSIKVGIGFVKCKEILPNAASASSTYLLYLLPGTAS